MTVTYTAEVATSSFACFLKLLVRWRGSIYKLMWREFLLFFCAYYFLSFIYRFALNESQMRVFEMLARYCEANNNLIPVAFVLGFYVSIVVSRWWEQFNQIPWPDRMALFITANVHGHDERGRLMRRTIMRYLCLSFVITLSSISPSVKKRFPTFTHMMDAGFMLSNELKVIEDIKTSHNKYFVPLVWATSLVTRGRKEGRIKDDFAVKSLIDELNEFRGMLGSLFNYDWISVPLVYTQVVTLSVYMFFLSCLMGRQFLIIPNTQSQDVYVPVFTFLQFFFYLGWLKVAESLVNPFGEDDDDFDVNYIIDRNLQVSYLVVDEMHEEHPELIKDAYWDDVDFELPYTAAAEQFRSSTPHLGSAMAINIPLRDAGFVPLVSIAEHQEVNLSENSMYPHIKEDISEEYQPSYTTRMGLLRFLKRSASRDSANMRNPNLLDSPLNKHRRKKMRRQESNTTHSQAATSNPPSPSGTSRQEDIFMMTDLSDRDDDVEHPLESGNPSRSSSLFFPMMRTKNKPAPGLRKEDGYSGCADVKSNSEIKKVAPSPAGRDTLATLPVRKTRSAAADSPAESVLNNFTASRDTIDKTPDDDDVELTVRLVRPGSSARASTDTLASASLSNVIPSLSSNSIQSDGKVLQPQKHVKSPGETEC